MAGALRELRVLEGPNLYFARAAIKATLRVTALTEVDDAVAARLGASIGLAGARPGAAGTEIRQRYAARVLARLVRHLAAAAGTHRLAVRVRPTADPDVVVVAYPWRQRTRAEALARGVGTVVDGLADGDIDLLLTEAAADVSAAEPGPAPTTIRPRIPVVAVTGTNGKTTTSRLIAHIARGAGLHVGWSSTDGVYADGVLVEPGDYSGPGGAGRVLAQPGVELAVTETARGGILLRGIGVTHNDVSVVTNVTADHLGSHGIDTVDQLAEVKAVVAHITKPTGWAVLNGDDPRVVAMRATTPAHVWVFSRHSDSPAVREALTAGGRATTVLDGAICVLTPGADPDPLIALADVPMTLFGLSRFNVENALAAASATLALGVSRDAVIAGLASFEPGPDLNPGRMNVYSLGPITVVLDLAHNEAGLDSLLEVLAGLRPAGGRLLLGLGTAGDRDDAILESMGAIAARGSDVLVIVQKDHYLRGRTTADMESRFRTGAAEVGVTAVAAYPDELSGLQGLLSTAQPGDVVGLMCHQDRAAVEGWLRESGATVDTPARLREKAGRAASSNDENH